MSAYTLNAFLIKGTSKLTSQPNVVGANFFFLTNLIKSKARSTIYS